MGLFSKTTEPNVLKFRVELDFSHTVAQNKNSGHLDKVAKTVIHVTGTGSFDVHSTVLAMLTLVYDVQKSIHSMCLIMDIYMWL